MSDTGLIRDEAEIHSHVSRVEVIAQLEATLLGDPSLLLAGGQCDQLVKPFHVWLSSSVLFLPGRGLLANLVPTCGLRRHLGRLFRIGSVFRTLTASRGVLLFYRVLQNIDMNQPKIKSQIIQNSIQVLPSKKITVQPNRPPALCCGRSQVQI